MKFLHILILSVFFISCQEQDIKIPVNDNHGIPEVWDNSRIYILFKKEKDDTLANLKLGQTISTTHWLTATDKRLKLKHLKKPIDKILKKRHKKSIHSKEGTHAYFSFIDSTQHKVAFIDFDSIQLMPDFYTSGKYFKEYPQAEKNFVKYHLMISGKQIKLNDSLDVSYLSKTELAAKLSKLLEKQNRETPHKLYLNFDSEVYFDRFLDYYTFFKNNPVDKLELSSKIFIFTP